MNIAQLRPDWKRLFRPIVIPGWLLLAWKVTSDISTLAFVHNSMGGLWGFAKSPAGNIVVILCGLAWIFVFTLFPRRHDTSTLGGFALKLRDDMKRYVEKFPKPESGIRGVGNDETIRQLQRLGGPASLREAALEHGFYLQFANRMERVYHEFGRFGIQDRELTTARAEAQYEMAYTYQKIMDALTRLSLTPEASEKLTPDSALNLPK